ncbi:type II toxin-antitoxin system RelE/ParE family toxin [Tianweitania sp. BSSL-BM11]|uniref:Type II toxin-antitoxin system RelE/ParE family toxin n=1 Tax=Tianweitania aestuarii TaxID=2814886 RepID=A0ABS5RVN0_9HYPH|nr:type II toxin-antitoxin system RelE/ParE family toxin [Tianweitania aestuarii]MBS9721076.1 type II toxin-antitoxin system RelE/ParE family toxin [Tianweitania aestuarii]
MRPVVWSRTALDNTLEILRYVAADDPHAAERLIEAIEAAGNRLGTVATGRPGRVVGTYEKSVARLPYVIAYAVDAVEGEERIVILRVIHTARHWPSGGWPQ